jgi:hypothetical protein
MVDAGEDDPCRLTYVADFEWAERHDAGYADSVYSRAIDFEPKHADHFVG